MAKRNKNMMATFDENAYIRLNKYLSDAGICSRREADRLIEEGKVKVDNEIAGIGVKILPTSKIEVDGKPVKRDSELVLIAVNKPLGIECTTSKKEPSNIVDFIRYPKRIYPVGRLDKDSEGLILMTNSGAIVNKIMKASNYNEKEYIVKIDKPVTPSFIRHMQNGVSILDTITRPCKVNQTGKCEFHIILTQGLNRQIRRMCEALGYRVLSLKRIRIMNIRLGRLKTGTYRNVTDAELQTLKDYLWKENESIDL